MPEYYNTQTGCRLTVTQDDPRSRTFPQLFVWLLFVSGGLTERDVMRSQIAVLEHTMLYEQSEGLHGDWTSLQVDLEMFV